MPQRTDKKDQPQKNLYALLIGINKYNKITGLKGCENDVAQFYEYLKSRTEYNLKEKILLNENATKANIIDKFENHLTQATENDIVFCFFAGHGIQEKTSIPVFQNAEIGNKIESFVCYDSNPFQQGSGENTCLADKEIRYLIHKIAQKNPHILLAFDSCHSGGITREDFDKLVRVARSKKSKIAQERPWESFYFHKEISFEDAKKAATLSHILPEGTHIQFSACRATEVSVERKIDGETRGVFTSTLIKILNAHQKGITYNSLKNQLFTYMNIWGEENKQTPQCYVSSVHPHTLYREFLRSEIREKPKHSKIYIDKYNQWCIRLGAIHGVRLKRKTKIWKDVNFTSFFEGKIQEVYPGFSVLDLPEAEAQNLNKKLSYDCEINIPVQFPISIFIHANDTEKREVQSSLENLLQKGQNDAFSFLEDERLANYALRIKENKFVISYPFDHRPLVEPIEKKISSSPEILYKYFLQIVKWESLRNSYSEETFLYDNSSKNYYKYPIELKVFRQNNEKNEPEVIPINRGSVSIPLTQFVEPNKKGEFLRFQLTNHSDRNLYCSLIYLSMAFGALPWLFPENGVWIMPGESVNHNQGEFQEVSLEDYIYDNEWKESLDYLKLIISTKEFDPSPMELAELPLPSRKSRSFNNGYDTSETDYYLDEEDWACWNLELRIQNPNLTTDQDQKDS